MINKLLEYLEGNPWLNLVFLFLAILSIVISIFLYFASKKEKEPLFAIHSFNLIKDNISELKNLKILFDKQEITTLTATQVAVWNSGREVINSSDIAQIDPLRIEVPEKYSILQFNIIKVVNTANNFTISRINERQVLIDFDYFYKNEGVIIKLYHTASSAKDIQLKGTIKGAKQIKNSKIPENDLADKLLGKLIKFIMPKNNIAQFFVILFLFPIIILPSMFLELIDSMRRLLLIIPKEFDVENID